MSPLIKVYLHHSIILCHFYWLFTFGTMHVSSLPWSCSTIPFFPIQITQDCRLASLPGQHNISFRFWEENHVWNYILIYVSLLEEAVCDSLLSSHSYTVVQNFTTYWVMAERGSVTVSGVVSTQPTTTGAEGTGDMQGGQNTGRSNTSSTALIKLKAHGQNCVC